MFLSSKSNFWIIFKADLLSKKLHCLKSLKIIGVVGYAVPIIFEENYKILVVVELKNINFASGNEHLMIGEKREKRDYFVTSKVHRRKW